MSAEHESDDSVNTGLELDDDDQVVVERPDDDDYDLLTFGEAGARLTEEIIKLERRIGALRSAGASADQLALAERRLDALRDAAERNRKPTIDELRESGFFGARD